MTATPHQGARRSGRWFATSDLNGFIHRVALRAEGHGAAIADGRPVIGVSSAWSELVNCNVHFRAITAAVKRGVAAAGGLALEFPTISLGENLMKPTAMLFRNLMAMDVEETIRANPMDAVVLIGGCDKTVPAQLMGAASVDLPTIVLGGGPAQAAVYNGRRLGSGTDLWEYVAEHRAGRMSDEQWAGLEAAAGPSAGHCTEMGTASTMATLMEALGMALPGSAAVPALDARRIAVAEETGRRAVELAREGLQPSSILTTAAFDNAIATLTAIGGSTNAVIHLLAIAGRVGVDLTLDRFDQVARRVPLLVNVRPAGQHLYEDLFRAGGAPAVMAEILPLLDGEAMTVTGKTVAENLEGTPKPDRQIIAALDDPLGPPGGIAVVRGSLAPDGAVLKRSAASAELLRHRGPAVVFDGIDDLLSRIDDPDLPVTAESVLVLRGAGPIGGPGMPEWGMLPIPSKLLREGVRDMVRVSDARMSGTGFGTVVLHVAPESAAGGPLALVRDGDPVLLDTENGVLDLDVGPSELALRRADLIPTPPPYRRGYGMLFLEHVLQADRGCDFDVLLALPGERAETDPPGLLEGWLAGW